MIRQKLGVQGRSARGLLNQNYQVAKARWVGRFHLDNLCWKVPILVNQMGKVGSSTIVASLQALRLDRPIYHLHTLTEEHMESIENTYRELYQSNSPDFQRVSHVVASGYLRKRLQKGLGNQRWKVISLVRDPISRNISDFFQMIDYWIPGYIERYEHDQSITKEAEKVFFEKYTCHADTITWLEDDLKQALGIDVYAKSFPQTVGYQTYEDDHLDLTVLKLEKLDQCSNQVFRELLNIEELNLVKTNEASKKRYGQAYRDFRRSLSFPDSYLDHQYHSQYMQHFYRDEEIRILRAHWSR